MAYVFGGSYIPLSCKLVENAIFGRNFTNEEIVKHLTGNNFQSCKASSAKDSTLKRNAAQTQIALVYFIGGLYPCYSQALISPLKGLGPALGF